MFRVVPALKAEHLGLVFRHHVFKMLLSKGKITEDLVSMLSSWRHSGFNVFYGSSILPRHEKSIENLAQYIIRASFSQERMTDVRQQSKVVYESKDGKSKKTFPKCHGPMRIISFIQDQEVIEKILKNPGLCLVKPKISPGADEK